LPWVWWEKEALIWKLAATTNGYELRVKYYFTRVENDKERSTREAAEAKVKAEKSAKRKVAAEKKRLKADAEYAEFLRLKEKFKEIET
jgi:predicted alpha/beta superfamily hydrolase